jgi:hypothetical protein
MFAIIEFLCALFAAAPSTSTTPHEPVIVIVD